MTQPWSERQREALRVFREAVTRRSERELAVAEESLARTQDTEQHYQTTKERVENEHAGGHADALNRAEQTRQQTLGRHDREGNQLLNESNDAKKRIAQDYRGSKDALEAEFRESRWTTSTLYEADKRTAKEEMTRANAACKKTLRTLIGHWRIGKSRIDGWEFLDEIPMIDPTTLSTGGADPWEKLHECAATAEANQVALSTVSGTEFINGRLPWLILIAIWMSLCGVAALGLYLFRGEDVPLPHLILSAALMWLLGAALVLPIGFWLINRLRNRTNDRVIALWDGLRRAVHLARMIRPICLKQAKSTYLKKKRTSLRRNRQIIKSLVEKTRVKLEHLREERDIALKKNDQLFKKRVVQQKQRQEKEVRAVEEAFSREQQEATARHEVDARAVEFEHDRRKAEDAAWHTETWGVLLQTWQHACDQFMEACEAIAKEADERFPDWSKPFVLPKTLPLGLPLGRMTWALEQFPNGVPVDPQLPRPDLSNLHVPALLPFPERASLLVRANDAGKAIALDALGAILLRCWTAMPAGKVRCTIIDPVGRGENFGAFMHLVDHDEKLVDGRIWTEPTQIDERLNNLTLHMENVLQKYLRNEFETLADYNAQAGEVAEPFHFLCVAHFPVNFSDDASRRLVSLASAGARCGIYTFVLVDTKQPMPHGFNIADLKNECTCLDWKAAPPSPSVGQAFQPDLRQGGEWRFVWEDADFGMFPLELEKSPPSARCTEILRYVGEEAVRSSKVEVPFEWIMPPRDAWWTSDSGKGIRVPVGRFGAQGRQYLELGLGTSQHVLVAGKTGSGKSTLLHVLITQLAMFYSPREIELYLVDFKKGVEFKNYASMALPHARVVAVESEREFGLSVLQRLDQELTRRGELYRTAGTNDVATFREHLRSHPSSVGQAFQPDGQAGKPDLRSGDGDYLPRIMLIVDEFQEFFIEDDKLAQESSLLMDRLVRQGRAFGIHVLLGSQTIGGAYSLARSTIDQMAVRIALQCSEADAHLILSRENTEARLLSRPGEGIYNAMHGMLEGNHLFQVVWLGDNKRDEILRSLRERAHQMEDFRKPIVFEGAAPADLDTNLLLKKLLREPNKPTHSWHAWMGDAVAIKDPTSAHFRKQSGSNLMVLGQNEDIAIALTLAELLSLGAAIDPALVEPSIHLVVGQALDAASETVLAALAAALPIRIWPLRDLGALLQHLAADIERRGQQPAPPRFLVLHGLHRLRDLRRLDDDFGYAKKGEEKSPFRIFAQLLKEGPPVGVFTLLWCDTFTNFQRSIDRQLLREFDMRVMMQMSGADSSAIMDSPIAQKLGPQRALYYTEDQGKTEKFRPYALPTLEWLKAMQEQAADLTVVSE